MYDIVIRFCAVTTKLVFGPLLIHYFYLQLDTFYTATMLERKIHSSPNFKCKILIRLNYLICYTVLNYFKKTNYLQ